MSATMGEDLYGLRRYRIDCDEFDFAIPGDEHEPLDEVSIQALARWFLYCAPHVRANTDTKTLLATA